MYCCTIQFYYELAQKSSISAMDAVVIFRFPPPPNLTNFPGDNFTAKLSACSPYGPISDGIVISNLTIFLAGKGGPGWELSVRLRGA